MLQALVNEKTREQRAEQRIWPMRKPWKPWQIPNPMFAPDTIVVIERNLDVIKRADWIITLGPEDGSGQGEEVAGRKWRRIRPDTPGGFWPHCCGLSTPAVLCDRVRAQFESSAFGFVNRVDSQFGIARMARTASAQRRKSDSAGSPGRSSAICRSRSRVMRRCPVGGGGGPSRSKLGLN